MYSIENAAAELMLEPAEMLEVYQIFIEDVPQRLDECQRGLNEMDLDRVRRTLHAVKSVASSLQMHELAGLVTTMEEDTGGEGPDRLKEELAAITREYHHLQAEIERFYQGGSGRSDG
ncbi:MAG: Hpt domain-containing protein [Firmicutes bacterium]|nr:Hpt domain-containing protein [Bacillota bacterium]